MLLPGLIWYILFKYLPMMGLGLAFTDYGFRAKVSFIGFENFRRLFNSAIFWKAFKNTLIISMANIVFYFPAPIIVALLINELKSLRAKRVIQFLIYIPYFFSWVVVGSIFVTLLSPSSGLVNSIIKLFGGDPIYFMASTTYFRPVLVSSYIWRQMGYGAVIYVAALSTVEPDLYEAATVDGAGRWMKLFNVTLPSIRSTIVTMLLLNLSHVLLIFEQVLVMYNAAVYDVADVLQTYVFREGVLQGDMGYSIAVGMFTSIISLVLVLTTNKISSRFLDEPIL
ncbi:ABC transporter permease subunit [Breznakiella homolactica]|uniref:Sugar ABC transporter permease n=2 Tax=Breznakiella homolactica TaxID=2798577 RepID=A0A7T7XRV3_9SPIR|nr:ABC transporter permease subunit [Breznakiella homolactica]